MKKYNFNHDHSQNPSTEEYKIIRNLADRLLYQTPLVNKCLETELFNFYEDIHNYGDACELCDACLAKREEECENPQSSEIFNWVAYDDASDWTLERLDKAGIPYINNDYGLWIGRGDYGSAQDIYFLPRIADALYNYEINEKGNMINTKTCACCNKEYDYSDESPEVKQGCTNICPECWEETKQD